MAHSKRIAGATLVRTGSGTSSAWEDLGISRNGVEIAMQPFQEDIPSDLFGGEAGPPCDINELGEIWTITCRFVSYDLVVARKVLARLNPKGNQTTGSAGAVGWPYVAGRLLFANDVAFPLQLNNASEPYQFYQTICRGAVPYNLGSRHSEITFVFEAHAYRGPNAGVNAGKMFTNTLS